MALSRAQTKKKWKFEQLVKFQLLIKLQATKYLGGITVLSKVMGMINH